jgi:hypothetical protein
VIFAVTRRMRRCAAYPAYANPREIPAQVG